MPVIAILMHFIAMQIDDLAPVLIEKSVMITK